MTWHFVIPQKFAATLEELPHRVVGQDYPYWLGGKFNWAAQAWLVLREHRANLTLDVRPRAGVVNFAHSMVWRELGPRCGEFRVSVRADSPQLFDVDFEILQNPAVRLSRRQAYLPYWPIPGLVPRDSARAQVRTVAYSGRLGRSNLAASLRRPGALHPALEGLEFRVVPPDRWHDMAGVDLLVAIRRFARDRHVGKPPSKLFNAWLAGIPLIAGWDSAFAAVGRPGIDYIRVDSEPALCGAVARLREDRAYYDRIVAEGRRRAADLSREALVQAWLAVLDGPVQTAFERWRASGGPAGGRPLARSLDLGRGALSRFKAAMTARQRQCSPPR